LSHSTWPPAGLLVKADGVLCGVDQQGPDAASPRFGIDQLAQRAAVAAALLGGGDRH